MGGCDTSDDGVFADNGGAGDVVFEGIGFPVVFHASRSMRERRRFTNRSGGRSGE